LADRVVPMLPPRLSNGICSLNPGVDRLTLSCVMEIDGHGEVRSYEIFPAVIRTRARLTYTAVNRILADEPGAAAGLEPLAPWLRPSLSGGICSLTPGVDRLALSCVMEIDGHGAVRSYEIFPSVIRTRARLTYAAVNRILADEPGAAAGLEPLVPMLREMAE